MAYIGNQPISAAFLVDTFSGNGSTVNYTMTVAPANTSSIIVAITGVVQDPSTYAVNGTTLTFSQAPPSGTSNISVRYLGIPASGVTTTAYRTQTEFTATAGQTTFTVPSYTVGYIDVYRNGLLLGSADFTATTGTTVVLAVAATAGDFIETVSFYVSSVLNAIPATTGSVGTTFIADNAITTAKIADSSITTAKIAAGAVVQADLETLVIPVGVGQTWQNVLASRASGTTYTNSTGRPIMVSVVVSVWIASVVVNGVTVAATSSANIMNASFIVPSGATYSVTVGGGSLTTWAELR